jgi:DNA-binding response OmpR family regulator
MVDATDGASNTGVHPTVLVVEARDDCRSRFAGILADGRYTVWTAPDGTTGLKMAVSREVELVVIGLSLPDIEDLEMIRRVRNSKDVPIIVASYAPEEADRVAGLDAGADDYLSKPVGRDELLAHIRARLRSRSGEPRNARIEHPGLVLDPDTRQVLVQEKPVELRRREFDLLFFLASSAGRVYSRAQLLNRVWGSAAEWQSEATVTEHVRRIREKIEQDPDSPVWLQTVYGVGYRFERRISQARAGSEDPSPQAV